MRKGLAAMWGMPVEVLVYLGKGDGVPPCFPSPQRFETWAVGLDKHVPHSGFCADCTPKYKEAQAGKCCHPGVTFGLDEDKFLAGKRPE